MRSYLLLEKIFSKIYYLDSAAAILHWDAATVMPSGSSEARGEQLATLSGLRHEMITDIKVRELLAQAEIDQKLLNAWQLANLKLMRRRFLHANCIPEALVKELSTAGTKCEMVWRDTKKTNNFSAYVPHQQKVLDLVRQVAALKAESFGVSRYDALLDSYDPGKKSAEIDRVFADLKTFLPTFTQKVLAKQKKLPKPILAKGPFPASKQKKLGEHFMKAIGFDFERGRLDISAHPFCGGVPGDVRITTRYDTSDFTSSLMGVLHETGHALYESNLPEEWRGQPVGDAQGMTLHESQSLLIEMQVCRSSEFLEYATPIIAKNFAGKGAAWTFDNLKRLYNHVEAGYIRVDADEVTYPSHVILRYEIEQKLINGDMDIADVPSAWNKGMNDLLGVKVPDYARGCMQDIHWTDGSFGYFPTYTLGAMAAAQFFHAAKKQNPDIQKGIKKGDFKPLTEWLKVNIHRNGSRLTADELLKEVTGEALNPEIYKAHLKNRYLA
ncbi:MAG: carboxypeptidase M32 [Proteobacteria bacterium]|nr:carboxypeptidase M32 [Pseudomonadota bacterium]